MPLRHHLSQDTYYTVVELILILRNGLLILATLRAILRPAFVSASLDDEGETQAAQVVPADGSAARN